MAAAIADPRRNHAARRLRKAGAFKALAFGTVGRYRAAGDQRGKQGESENAQHGLP